MSSSCAVLCTQKLIELVLGSSLLFKIKEAQTEKAEHGAAFEEFDSVIPSENHVAWKVEMEAWEENPNNTTVSNPLQLKGIGEFDLISLVYPT